MENQTTLLTDFLWIAGVASLIVLLFQRFKIPDIIGLMVTGLALGPTGFGIVRDTQGIGIIADLGITLLLFTVGLEFSFEELKRLRKIAVLGGTIQVALTIAVLALAAKYLLPMLGLQSFSNSQAILLGILGSLSSTAIVLRILTARRELEAPHGRIALGVLLWQDIVVVALIWIVTFLSPAPAGHAAEPLVSPAFTLPVFIILFFVLKWLLPSGGKVMTHVRSKEVFVLISLFLCFGAAKLTHEVGLSAAFGAFAAGVIIAGTDFGSKVSRTIEPIRDSLASLFFVSIGLLVHMEFANIPFLLLSSIGLILAKTSIVLGVCLILGYSARVGLIAGLALAQVGEFSFVILSSALQGQLVDHDFYQKILATIMFSQILTPLIIAFAPSLANHISGFGAFDGRHPNHGHDEHGHGERRSSARKALEPADVFIFGFGVCGHGIYKQLSSKGFRVRVLEMDRTNVSVAAKAGFDIHYGDATDTKRLCQIGADTAPVVVISVSDSQAVPQIIRKVRNINPATQILARIRFQKDEKSAQAAGADYIFVEEVEIASLISDKILKISEEPATT